MKKQTTDQHNRGSQKKPIIVLDLDETLITSVFDPNTTILERASFTISNPPIAIFMRNYLIEFLQRIYQDDVFDLAIFTMATRDYADLILDQIQIRVFANITSQGGQVSKPLFSQRKYRDDCSADKLGNYKDLSKINPDDSSNILLVDDLVTNFKKQNLNGIPIRPFNNINKQDIELLKLYLFLMSFDPNKPLIDQNVFVYNK